MTYASINTFLQLLRRIEAVGSVKLGEKSRTCHIAWTRKDVKENTMPEERELSEEEKRLYLKGGLVTLVVASGIGLPGFWIVTNFVVAILRLGPDKVSLLATFRAIIALAYPLLFIPTVILVAFVVNWIWKKSSFLLNAAILCCLSGEFVLILIALVTLFDAALPGVSVTLQVPLMAVSLGIALLAMVKSAQIRPIRSFIQKSFK